MHIGNGQLEGGVALIQVYTGDGKGKSTAAFGLALRAAGAGLNIFIGQFIKGRDCSELKSLKKFKNIKLVQFGSGCFVGREVGIKNKLLARKGLEKIREVAANKKYNVIILDEINAAIGLGLLEVNDVLRLINEIPKTVEIVLTGRRAPTEIIENADLVTEMKEIKHYFSKGIKARKGIEH